MAKPTGDDLVKMASAMAGKPYIFGYEVRLSDPNPKALGSLPPLIAGGQELG